MLRESRKTSSIDEALESAILERVEDAIERATEGREVMTAKEAADYLRVSSRAFESIAPTLPRHEIGPRTILYIRSELLAWLKSL